MNRLQVGELEDLGAVKVHGSSPQLDNVVFARIPGEVLGVVLQVVMYMVTGERWLRYED